ncbi:HlyC/CorC family transporter [Gymnodinialimonas ceratoperidinii]|uniref:HlyC/CorC family transporter n=1 Tax=Gymnodinialimonas ceratoperidinii TaxID=2856823 RepID=A0A8F6TTM8_9RHOB|nr:HlyC/CorC family transporter [Gymnodinialimonas ceratoperidinii]QXT38495.1 HlyC/CorC family transporter [Gymnodinialimonas ceratoperidinii]
MENDTPFFDPTALSDPTTWIVAAVIFALLIFSGFFSGSETALTAASRGKLRSMADKDDRSAKGAQKALDLKEDNERLIGGILLGNNLVNILATSLATVLFTTLLGEGAIVAATLVMTALVLIFAEVLPKTYAITNPETSAARIARPIALIIALIAPVVTVVRFVVRGVLRLFGLRIEAGANMLSVREEIMGALTIGHQEGSVEKEQRDRLLGALDLHERTVEEIMLHRSGIEMIDADADPQEILSQALQSPHTRLPVFRDDPENIVGVVHAKDLLRAIDRLTRGENAPGLDSFDISAVAMKPYFVPETTTLDDQMRQFLRRHTHFALVVDEYGALGGLITLEDILEEIVGEITDEFDTPEAPVLRPDAAGNYTIDGAMTIRDLNRATDWSLPDEEANTVAGLVIHEAQTIPLPGQCFAFHGFRFEVAGRDANRLTKLKIRRL